MCSKRSAVLNVKSSAGSTTAAARNVPLRETFRLPLFPRLFSLFGVVVLGGLTALMALLAILVLVNGEWALGALVMAPLTGFMAYLTSYAASDMRAKWRLRVALEPDLLVLDLPAERSLIHHPGAEHVSIRYSDIETIESRLEAYRSLWMAMMQRSYVLRRKTGELIFLFEDRAIGTPFETSFFPSVAAEIVARAGVPLIGLGVVEGGGGALGIWGTHAPDWAAPSLSAARQRKIWRAVKTTGVLSIVVIVIALTVRLLSGPL
jgi:hypothetical protein